MFTASHRAANGVPQRIAQSHMRHSNPMLTAVTYTDPEGLPVANTIAALAPLPTTRPAPLPPTISDPAPA